MQKRKAQSYYYPKLKGIRNEYGYTLEDVAKFLGISKNSYYRKEKGKTDFFLDEVRKILFLFNVSFNDIFLPETSTKELTTNEQEERE